MNRYLVGYKCYFGHRDHERLLEIEAESKERAKNKAIEQKRSDPGHRIEFGGVDFGSFRVIKKLQKR